MANARQFMAARTAAWAKSDYTAKDYVQDGLIAMWDGIENAGWGVHDPNATTWKDLVGDNDATLSVYGEFGNKWLQCLGTSYAAKFSHAVDDCVTLQVVVSDSTKRGVLIKLNGSFWIYDQYSLGDFGCSYNNPCYTANKDALSFLTLVYDVDGKFLSAAFNKTNSLVIGTGSPPRPSGIPTIGGRSNAAGGFNGEGRICKIHSIRVYSKEPSIDEIAANYAIDRARFNLT